MTTTITGTPLPLLDAHMHVIDRDNIQYNVAEFKTLPALAQNWTVERYEAEFAKHLTSFNIKFCGAVLVEVNCAPESVGKEGRWFTTRPKSVIRALVPTIPMPEGANAVMKHIRDLSDLSSQRPIRAVRYLIQDRPTEELRSESYITTVQRLADAGIAFELCLRQPQWPDVIALMRAIDRPRFILNHLGKVDPKKLLEWGEYIKVAASIPGTICKLSGVFTEFPEAPSSDTIMPIVAHCINTFTPDRVMFGTDWFVLTLSSSPVKWLSTLLDCLLNPRPSPGHLPDSYHLKVPLSRAELNLVFHDTCQRAYGIDGARAAQGGCA